MTPTFVAYIDESGDEGFAFGKGSSDWFVLSAVVVRKSKDLATVKLVDKVRAQLGRPPNKPLHFRDLKHEQRLPLIAEIAKADLRAVTVLVHKPSILEPEKFRERYRLYFYTGRYLFERLSWFCRDHRTSHDAGDGTVQIVFSNRAGTSYDELRRYLEQLEGRSVLRDVRIDWSVLKRDQIIAYTPEKRRGLQIADAVASGFFYAVQPSIHGFTEDRYARMLKPVVYHRQGWYLGYGLKFWPRELDEQLKKGERYGWVRQGYQ